PVLSSKRSSFAFCAEPPLLLRVTSPERVLWSGRAYLGILTPLYTEPVTTGLSGSPSRNWTTTSSFRRGQKNVPHPLPAQGWATRTHVLSMVFGLRSLSQKNCTQTLPILSMNISSPLGATTIAV